MFKDVSSEKDYERMVIRRLKKYGYAAHIECSIPGFPDIVFIRNSRIRLIEMKKGTQEPDKLLRPTQNSFIKEMNNNGTDVYVVMAHNKTFRLFKNKQEIYSGNIDDVVKIIVGDVS